MANPVSAGTFECWIADTQPFTTAPPRSGGTGEMETWLADTQLPTNYAKAAARAGSLGPFNPPHQAPFRGPFG